MLNCAIYPRKSKQVDNSDSMDVQIDMCIRYLNNKYGEGNYNVTIYDGDYGITGHSIKARKDFQRMMRDVAEKKIQLVVVQRYDRLARNTRDFCNVYHEMEVAGCNLVSVSQEIDTTTPYGKNFMYMQASMAELEWALNSERRKDAIRYANSIGKCTLPDHSFPFGYKPKVIDGVRRMVKDEEKKEIVEDIFAYYLKYTNYIRTAKYINEKYGTNITHKTIKNVFKNTCFYGSYRGNDNFCEPYITKEQWDRLQIKRPCIRLDDKKRTEILFSGMIRCPKCHHLMRSTQKTYKSGNIYRYFHCEFRTIRLCEFKGVKSERYLEKKLIEYINNYIEELTVGIKQGKESGKKKVDNSAKYQQELDRLNTMYLKGRITEDYYDTEYLRLTTLIAQNKAHTHSEAHEKKLQEVFFDNWTDLYWELDKLHRKLFWREAIQEIIVDEEWNIVNVIFLP